MINTDAHFEQQYAQSNPHLHYSLIAPHELSLRKKTLLEHPRSLLTQKRRMLMGDVFDKIEARNAVEHMVIKQMQDVASFHLDRKKSHQLLLMSHLSQAIESDKDWHPKKAAFAAALPIAQEGFAVGTFSDVEHHVKLGESIQPQALLTVIAAAHDARSLQTLKSCLSAQAAVAKDLVHIEDASVLRKSYAFMQAQFNAELDLLATLTHQDLHKWHNTDY